MRGGAGACGLDSGQRVRRRGHGIEYFGEGEHHAPSGHAAAGHASASNPTATNPTTTHTYATRTTFGDTAECELSWCDDGREQLPNHYTAELRDGERDDLQRECCGSGIWDFGSHSSNEYCSGPKHHI